VVNLVQQVGATQSKAPVEGVMDQAAEVAGLGAQAPSVLDLSTSMQQLGLIPAVQHSVRFSAYCRMQRPLLPL